MYSQISKQLNPTQSYGNNQCPSIAGTGASNNLSQKNITCMAAGQSPGKKMASQTGGADKQKFLKKLKEYPLNKVGHINNVSHSNLLLNGINIANNSNSHSNSSNCNANTEGNRPGANNFASSQYYSNGGTNPSIFKKSVQLENVSAGNK